MYRYHTKAIHALVECGFTEADIWRKALGDSEPLLVFADRLPMLDAPEFLPSGHSGKFDFSLRAGNV